MPNAKKPWITPQVRRIEPTPELLAQLLGRAIPVSQDEPPYEAELKREASR